MQKFKLFLFFLLLPTSVLFSQEKTKTQDFYDLLMSSRFFEAFEYYEKYEVEINAENPVEGETYYNFFKYATLNEYDASIPYFNYINNNVGTEGKYQITNKMLDFAFNSQKYGDIVSLANRLIEILNSGYLPISDNDKANLIGELTRLINLYSLLAQEDEMKICFGGSSVVEVTLDHSPNIPIIEANIKGHPTRTLFDTGFSPPLSMTRKLADSIGIRIICDEFVIELNNISTPVAYGILDSLQVGNLIAYNVLVMILDMDKRDQEDSVDIFKNFDSGAIIGLQFMKQLGSATLDFKHEKLLLTPKEATSKDNYNMLLYGYSLYIRTALNNVVHTGMIDTGNNTREIMLNNNIYNKHKKEFGTPLSEYVYPTYLMTHIEVDTLGVLENLYWSLSDQPHSLSVDVSERSRVRLDATNGSAMHDAFYGFLFMWKKRIK